MNELEQQFQQAMIDLYTRSMRELRYDARWFLQMVAMDGAVPTAR
jgi:hypothetical protein